MESVVAKLMALPATPVNLEGPAEFGPLIYTIRCGVRFKKADKWRVQTSDGVWQEFP